MKSEQVWLGEAACPTQSAPVEGGFATIGGETFAKIDNVDAMPPFLMSVVCSGNVWLFAGSNGAFSAGRVSPDGALLPYQTADKMLRDPNSSGALSVFLVRHGGHWRLWEPWQQSGRVYHLRRTLYKHVSGTSVIFEEANEDLGLTFRWSLGAGDSYGVVRECCLENHGAEPVDIRYLDGWRRLQVPGVSQETFARYSYLAEGYMRHERVPSLPLGLFTLNAGISDTSEPCESLRVAAAWSLGHANPLVLLCERQVEAFRRGEELQPEAEIRGESGAFLIASAVVLKPEGLHQWIHAADTGLDHAAVARLEEELRDPDCLEVAVREDLAASRRGVRALVAAADGLQNTTDGAACAHHFANVLFNCMRGGTFGVPDGFQKADLAAFLLARNTALACRHAPWLDELPEGIGLQALLAAAMETRDAQLARLIREYLPLTFSRRHGDPSRPWNHFSIHTRDEAGNPVYGYQGNWRDIFQNWEGLAQSFPVALDAMIAVFLNASSADGYNPYRITREGIDWEVHDPDDPWSNTGYWGDHQIVYLLRLLESSERFHPARVAAGLREETYCYSHIPYEIAGFDAILADPRHSIRFNTELHGRLLARSLTLGADGKLLTDRGGSVLLVSLAEKLFVPLLAKLSNLVPDGGIWLNTQRPEWNDANNALAGWGLSVVTVQYVRRYLVFLSAILADAGDDPLSLSTPVADFVGRITSVLEGASAAGTASDENATRFRVLAELGRAGEAYRITLYRSGLEGRTTVPVEALRRLIAAALPIVERTIESNRRPDGLYHSYNVLHIVHGDRAEVRRLYLMLEGQVAALSSGLLEPGEALGALNVLRASELYRADQKSYMLYPDKVMAPFGERNTLPSDAPQRARFLDSLVGAGDRSLVVPDVRGRWHFHASLRNVTDLAARLDEYAATGRWRAQAARDRLAVLDLWEDVFHHSEFTGRSGTFFMFEGLGSVYWHMVAKLMLATQECWRRSVSLGADAHLVDGLAQAYENIRDGLGYRKTPAEYGAFPTDPYSHTPGHRGAQQPGMTGQVKEEILCRWGELGVEVKQGVLRFAPRLLSLAEFHAEPTRYDYIKIDGSESAWDLAPNSLAFTFCQIPVCYQLEDASGITIETADGSVKSLTGSTLSAEDSASIFERQGRIARLTVNVRKTNLRP